MAIDQSAGVRYNYFIDYNLKTFGEFNENKQNKKQASFIAKHDSIAHILSLGVRPNKAHIRPRFYTWRRSSWIKNLESLGYKTFIPKDIAKSTLKQPQMSMIWLRLTSTTIPVVYAHSSTSERTSK